MLFFLSPLSLTGVALAVLPREDTIESEAAMDMVGELSCRRRLLMPDEPAMGCSSAAVSGRLLAASGVRTCAAFSSFLLAIGGFLAFGCLGFGVEVVLEPPSSSSNRSCLSLRTAFLLEKDHFS
jgi:hypothetical protein